MSDRYAVIGNPIGHSKSPMIHASFAEQTGEDMIYDTLFSEIDQFAEIVERFFSDGGKGLNVTVPFKQNAYNWVTELTERARIAGAVNTIIPMQNGYLGDNTDGIGIVRDITHNLGVSLSDKTILILGAGGAVRGVLKPILDEHPDCIHIANRTISKAEDLATLDDCIHGMSFTDINTTYDVVINGTSASLSGDLPPLPKQLFNNGALAYDMMYAEEPTVFMQWAQTHGAEIISDGLGMLVEQAAEAFYLWRNKQPDSKKIPTKIRQTIS